MGDSMLRLVAILLAGLSINADAAMAQDKYPSRPIKVIVPYAPGGATDIVARIVGDEFQKITGQGFVVLNKPGAFGMLAIDEMVKSSPDGYTLMIGNVSTNAITPIIYAKKNERRLRQERCCRNKSGRRAGISTREHWQVILR